MTKIGYALGGGAALGLAHIGVLKALEEHNLAPDIIVGTSMGAIIGALYAGGYKAKQIEEMALSLDWRRLFITDITLSADGIFQGRKVVALLKQILGSLSFTELKCAYACTAVDIASGEEVILNSGSLVDAVHASMAHPGVFKPVKMDKRYLVDGGLINEVPASVCRRLGADYVIGVNVIPDPEKYLLNSRKNKRRQGNDADGTKPPTLVEIVRQSITIMQHRVATENLKEADLQISPDTAEIGFWHFNHIAEAIAAGEKAAHAAIHAKPIPIKTKSQ
jgi:NTE family protein